MVSYLSQLAFGMFGPTPAPTPEVDVHSQSEMKCCTSSTVILDDDDEPSRAKKRAM